MDHKPVLLNEVIKTLDPRPGEFFVDGTLGEGGHALEIIKRIGRRGKFIGIDLDKESIERFKEKIDDISEKVKPKIILIQGNFADIKKFLKKKKLGKINGLLLDLGFSSHQLESVQGLSFSRNKPLIMRYDKDFSGLTAARVVNEYDEKKLAEIFKRYGEEKFAKRIAQGIAKERRKKPIRTAFDLVEIVKKYTPARYPRRIHPATRVFLALRMFVNKELDNLEKVLSSVPDITKKNARIAVISFNSLEDRIVKTYFKNFYKEGKAEILTKKPITPSKREILENPRSRSAKLRVIKIK